MRTISKALKYVIISAIEIAILIYTYKIVGFVFEKTANSIGQTELWMGHYYQNITTLLIIGVTFLLIGIILFTIFKFIEIKFISTHEKTSYQYLLIPCSLIVVWEIIYNILNLNECIIIWSPIALTIILSNLIYELIISKNNKKVI